MKLIRVLIPMILGVLIAEVIIWPMVAGYFVPSMTAMCSVAAALR